MSWVQVPPEAAHFVCASFFLISLKAGHPGVPSYMYICLFVRDMVGWVILLSFLSYFLKLVCYAHVFPCNYMYIKFGTKALVVLLSHPCPSAAWLGVGVYTDSLLEVVADESH